MADIIGQETWTADGIDYVIKVTEPGATVTENAIKIISPVTLRRGDPNADPLTPILVSSIQFSISDTGRLFSDALDGKQQGDIVLEFTEDGNTLFKGYVVPEYERDLIYQGNPQITIQAFDGIAGLKGVSYDQVGAQTVREQLYNISNQIGLGLQLNSVFGWEHTGADAGTGDVDKLRLCVEQLLNGKEDASYHDVLTLFCEFYTAQFFQEDGEWWFMQREERGGTLTNYPTNSSGASLTTETSVDLSFAVTNSTIHRASSFYSKHPAVARVVSKHIYPSYLLKNATWEDGNKYWDNNSQDEASSRGRKITGNNGYLRQTVGETFIEIPASSLDQLTINFDAWIKVALGATGTHSVDYLEIKAVLSDGTTYYRTTGGAWSGTQQYVSTSFDFGTFSGSERQVTTTITTPDLPGGPVQMTITLFFQKDASGSAADLEYIDIGPLTVRHVKPDEADDVFRAEEFVVTEETGNPGGNQEQTFYIGDTDNNTFFGPGVFEFYDGSDWLPTYSWAPSAYRIHEKRALSIIGQIGQRLDAYEFSHKWGEDPKLYNALTYDSKTLIPVYIEKEYARNAKTAARTKSLRLL